MKKIQSYIIAILTLGLVMVGCNGLEDNESSDVASNPTATLDVSAVGDSAFLLTYGSNKAGYLGYVLSDDTAASVEAINIISGNLEGDALAVSTMKIDDATDINTTIGGLMPNSFYKVFVASSNIDGVESDVEEFILKTDDGVGPSFSSSSPSISSEAEVEVGADVVLTFDEPVLVGDKTFTFEYYFEGESVAVPAENVSAAGNTITVKQPHMGHTGDYFFLSWEAGAVTDLSLNPCDERISGVVGGALAGNYYRFEHMDFDVASMSLMPSIEELVADDNFVIEIAFPFAIEIGEDATKDMVMLSYSHWDNDYINAPYSAFNNISVVNDTILRIEQPEGIVNNGDMISLFLAEGFLSDTYGNMSATSDYEINWQLGDFMFSGDADPVNGSLVTTQTFYVEIDFGFPIKDVMTADKGMVTMTYTSEDGTESIVPVTDYGVDSSYNDSIFYANTPNPVDFGGSVQLNVGENVIMDSNGNVNLELREVYSWSVPKLAESIDILIGQYSVAGNSGFDPYDPINDTITISLKEGTTDELAIYGLFGYDTTIYATFDAGTPYLDIPVQSLGLNSSGAYEITVMNAATESNAGGYVLEDGSISMSYFGIAAVPVGTSSVAGFFEYIPECTWTKLEDTVSKSSVVSKTSQYNRVRKFNK